MTVVEAQAIESIKVVEEVVNGEIYCLIASVDSCDEYLGLPNAVSYSGKSYIKTGWNSDRYEVYYKPGTGFATF